MIIILFTQLSKTINFISVYFIIYKITRLEERTFYFNGFFKATRYPWFRELLKLAIRNSLQRSMFVNEYRRVL